MRTAAALAALAAALLLATAAPAQTPAPSAAEQPPLMTAPRPEDKPTTDPTASPSGIGGAAPSDELQRAAPPAPPAARGLSPDDARALVGKEVRTRDGQAAGEIRDFTLVGPEGRIERVVLAAGGLLGVGKTLVSVPVTVLRTEPADVVPGREATTPTNVSLDLDAADLAEAPEFTYKDGERTLVGKP